MEVLSLENVGFQYAGGSAPVLENVSFSVEQGELVLVCGPCGCGKTTLLRLLKEELRPAGELQGTCRWSCQSRDVGFLFQNPDSQLVCQTVLEELVFGAENIGMKREEISRELAEISAYLGIEDLLERDVNTLSGGQKQSLNLASILMLKPKVLLLDEPVSQLDPVSAYDFLKLLEKIREDLNVTILMVEHKLDGFLGMAEKVVYMEEGRVSFVGNGRALAERLLKEKAVFAPSLPEATRLQHRLGRASGEPLALSLRELLGGAREARTLAAALPTRAVMPEEGETVARIKGCHFRYEKNGRDVLKGLELSLKRGRIYGLIGGNGAGKSTLLSLLVGTLHPLRGKVRVEGKVGMLPQNPIYAFFKDVLSEDCEMISSRKSMEELLGKYEFFRELSRWFDRNPLDLSGGWQQKAAIFKMLLGDGDLLLMDEPTKAMDGHEKETFLELIEMLRKEGKTVLLVSHDLEFVEKAADECLLMFDGKIIARDEPARMFEDNRFYTTLGGRIRGLAKDE